MRDRRTISGGTSTSRQPIRMPERDRLSRCQASRPRSSGDSRRRSLHPTPSAPTRRAAQSTRGRCATGREQRQAHRHQPRGIGPDGRRACDCIVAVSDVSRSQHDRSTAANRAPTAHARRTRRDGPINCHRCATCARSPARDRCHQPGTGSSCTRNPRDRIVGIRGGTGCRQHGDTRMQKSHNQPAHSRPLERAPATTNGSCGAPMHAQRGQLTKVSA
jgi:hypothetical protein